jgi:endonuclease/exonuclease/phosphatase family metal-dependent hydrolase
LIPPRNDEEYQIAIAETSFLVGKMQQYIDDLTVLMGDLNFVDTKATGYQYKDGKRAAILREGGWCHPLVWREAIDQIWCSPILEPYVQPGPELTSRASDHQPVVVEIGIP